MLRKLLLFTIMVCGLSLTNAEDLKPIFKRNPPSQNGTGGGLGNAPLHLPINVDFEYSTGNLTVSAPEELEGYVYVYTLEGALEATSPQLNCTLSVPQTSDIHVISLQGESWIGEAKILY